MISAGNTPAMEDKCGLNPGCKIQQVAYPNVGLARISVPFRNRVSYRLVQVQNTVLFRCHSAYAPEPFRPAENRFRYTYAATIDVIFEENAIIPNNEQRKTSASGGVTRSCFTTLKRDFCWSRTTNAPQSDADKQS
jgi:hypothetical protein